jgi:hypothetical protein
MNGETSYRKIVGLSPFPKLWMGRLLLPFVDLGIGTFQQAATKLATPFDSNGDAIGDPVDLLAHEAPNAKWEDGFQPGRC